ncbi:MAG TPA: site-specific integrase [Alphaproteobacteria bacterium]|nr:site-specific integrase [Alphaproteobacteria bacterium]
MKPTDFAKYLTEFLSRYLPEQKNVSKNTIRSYRDTFKLLITYCQEMKKIPAEKITLSVLSSEWITGFLEWLEGERKCSISTRNQRLAAIHSFFRYVQAEEPAGMFHFQKITAITIKKAKRTVVEYLTPEAIKLLLEQPDKHTPKGVKVN